MNVLESGVKVFWSCRYKDGSTFHQFWDEKEHSTNEIDRSNLASISLHHANGDVITSLEFTSGQYPFYRRRTSITPGIGVVVVIHILGWRIPGDPEVRHVIFLHEDGMQIVVGDFTKSGDQVKMGQFYHPIVYNESDNIPVQ